MGVGVGQIKVVVTAFVEMEGECDLVVLTEPDSGRYVTVPFGEELFIQLCGIFNEPGEPLIGQEFTVAALKSAGVSIASITLRLVNPISREIAFTIALQHGEREWTMPAMGFDALGCSIASHVPILVDEAEFQAMVSDSESSTTPEDAAIRLAQTLPNSKIGQS